MDKKPKLSNAKIDELTIKVSTLLCQEGFDFKYNEDQNCIRTTLANFFSHWADLQVEDDATARYTDWKSVRTKLHIPDPFK